MEKSVIEKLNDAMWTKKSRIVAGLDPTWDLIPKKFYDYHENDEEEMDEVIKESIIRSFCIDYIDAVEDLVPAIKINSAFFEEEHYEEMYREVASYAKHKGLLVIGDVKRADIGSTSEAYAKAFLGEYSPFDAITINPYFGTDGIKPFIKMVNQNKKAVFILVKTSNESSSEIQDLELSNGLLVHEAVADLVNQWGNYTETDNYGYKLVGAVVGATHPKQAAELRKRMPKTFFLVPGYGAQGATAEDVAVNFDSAGLGAIVNSSRGLMCAYKKAEYSHYGEGNWQQATRVALKKSIAEINEAIEARKF